MEPKITVDTRAFKKAFNEYMRYSKKTVAEVVNTKALFIARGATHPNNTKRAKPKDIRAQLNRPSRNSPKYNIASQLVMKSMREKGENVKDFKRSAIKKKGRTYINKKVRSSGFLASGWIEAVRKMMRFTEYKSSIKIRGLIEGKTKKGGAKPAKVGLTTSAQVYNSVQSSNTGAQSIINKGVAKAMAYEVASMKKYVQNKMAKDAARFNKR